MCASFWCRESIFTLISVVPNHTFCNGAPRLRQGRVFDDLVLLNNISEDEILGTLRRRFESDLIYTTIGPVLLSVNPFHDMARLYLCAG